MMKLHPIILTALTVLVTTAACRGTEDDGTDEDQQEAGENQEEEEGDLPDLPCGGADLMTDNHNCGTCGHECPVWYEGTEWEAGSCKDGECGPVWSTCVPEFGTANCEEVCKGFGQTCVANGCSGLTALLYGVGLEGCDMAQVYDTMEGACDEPIPWMSTVEWSTEAKCCCK